MEHQMADHLVVQLAMTMVLKKVAMWEHQRVGMMDIQLENLKVVLLVLLMVVQMVALKAL